MSISEPQMDRMDGRSLAGMDAAPVARFVLAYTSFALAVIVCFGYLCSYGIYPTAF